MKTYADDTNNELERIKKTRQSEITASAIYKVTVKATDKTCYAVPSDSQQGVYYITCFDEKSTSWTCTCPAGQFGKICKHAKAAQVSVLANIEASEIAKIAQIAETAKAEKRAAIAQHQAELDAAKVRPNYEARGTLNGNQGFSLLR